MAPFAAFLFASTTDAAETFFDDTFAGVHQLSWFDWSLLLPYFAVLFILSFYGIHRYRIIRMYYANGARRPVPAPAKFDRLPRVTIQLPLYNERFVVERVIEHAVAVRYPRELLQIQVLDDSTDETHPFTQALVGRYQAMGYPIEYHHRPNR